MDNIAQVRAADEDNSHAPASEQQPARLSSLCKACVSLWSFIGVVSLRFAKLTLGLVVVLYFCILLSLGGTFGYVFFNFHSDMVERVPGFDNTMLITGPQNLTLTVHYIAESWSMPLPVYIDGIPIHWRHGASDNISLRNSALVVSRSWLESTSPAKLAATAESAGAAALLIMTPSKATSPFNGEAVPSIPTMLLPYQEKEFSDFVANLDYQNGSKLIVYQHGSLAKAAVLFLPVGPAVYLTYKMHVFLLWILHRSRLQQCSTLQQNQDLFYISIMYLACGTPIGILVHFLTATLFVVWIPSWYVGIRAVGHKVVDLSMHVLPFMSMEYQAAFGSMFLLISMCMSFSCCLVCMWRCFSAGKEAEVVGTPSPVTRNGQVDVNVPHNNTHAKIMAPSHGFSVGDLLLVTGMTCCAEAAYPNNVETLLRCTGHRVVEPLDKDSVVIKFNVQVSPIESKEEPRIQAVTCMRSCCCCSLSELLVIFFRPFAQCLFYLVICPIVLICVNRGGNSGVLLISFAVLFAMCGCLAICRNVVAMVRCVTKAISHVCRVKRYCHWCIGNHRRRFNSACLLHPSVIGHDVDSDDSEHCSKAANFHDVVAPLTKTRARLRQQQMDNSHRGWLAFMFEGFRSADLHPSGNGRYSNAWQWCHAHMDCGGIAMSVEPWVGAMKLFNLLYVHEDSCQTFLVKKNDPLVALNSQPEYEGRTARIVPLSVGSVPHLAHREDRETSSLSELVPHLAHREDRETSSQSELVLHLDHREDRETSSQSELVPSGSIWWRLRNSFVHFGETTNEQNVSRPRRAHSR